MLDGGRWSETSHHRTFATSWHNNQILVVSIADIGFRWFTVCMGTGIVSVLLNTFPYPARWLYWLSIIVFCLNIALFVSFIIISILRYTLWPEAWRELKDKPNQAFYLGAIPIVRIMKWPCRNANVVVHRVFQPSSI
jgi:hypothetical protein